jgi:hypothetical protein
MAVRFSDASYHVSTAGGTLAPICENFADALALFSCAAMAVAAISQAWRETAPHPASAIIRAG